MALYSTTTRRRIAAVIVFLGLLFLPACLQAIDQGFYVSFASRVLIMALAATSLNLVIGFGGMVSFGHAAFFGTGAYAVTILSAAGSNSAMVTWPIAAIAAAILALAIGAISLRTRGVYFIMITLAFAQMAYYLFVSLKVTGGDDGMPLAQRSSFSTLDLADDTNFYYVALAVLSLALFLLDRLRIRVLGESFRASAKMKSGWKPSVIRSIPSSSSVLSLAVRWPVSRVP